MLVFLVVSVVLIAILKLKKKNISKKEIALVGERGSGKTQLFIGLNKGKALESAPSLVNNHSELTIGSNKYKLTDFIGDNVSKE